MTIKQHGSPEKFFRTGAREVVIEQCNYPDSFIGFFVFDTDYWYKVAIRDFARVAVFKVKAKEVNV